MARTALVFTPVVPFPANTGIERRVADTFISLRALGYSTVLASAAQWNSAWTPGVVAAMRGRDVDDTRVLYRLPTWVRAAGKARRAVGRLWGAAPEPTVPPAMRRWFSRVVDNIDPALILFVYSRWDGLLDHRRYAAVPRVVDPTDLESLNLKMWHALAPRLPPPPIDPAAVDPEVLELNFFDRLALEPDPGEFDVYDRYDATLTVSRKEDEIVRRHTRRTRVVYAPITHAPVPLANTRDGDALMTTGPNPYNVQGYLYFARHVLPRVRRAAPDFRLTVTGSVCGQVVPADGVCLAGRLPSLLDAYAAARMIVCPVFGGTGQQVKIVEAMAHGVPPVAIRPLVVGGPIVHEVNGLVAEDAEAFARHVVRLWTDPSLRRRLGEAARATVAETLSNDRLAAALAEAAGGGAAATGRPGEAPA